MPLSNKQADLLERTRQALRIVRAVIMQAPTGFGKSYTAAYMVGQAQSKGSRVYIIAHRHELISQLSEALWGHNIRHGLVVASRRLSSHSIQIAAIQTLIRRLERLPEPDLIIIDEAHRSISKSYKQVIEYWPSAKVVGLTATPQRTDGKGLDDIYGELCVGPTIRELIRDGWLSDYRLFAPPTSVNLDDVHTRGGDYVQEELEQAVDKKSITGDAVEHYKQYAYGQRCIVFCVSRQHAENVALEYQQQGIPAQNIDGSTPTDRRKQALADFREGKLWVLCGVNLFVEGLDIPDVYAVQQLRPTQSLIIYMQAIGRGLRAAPGKTECVILDHVGNCHRHGLPDDDREWSLQGKRKQKSSAKVTIEQCPVCHAVHRPAKYCPSCGHQIRADEPPEPEQEEGQLQEVDKEKERKKRKKEQGRAKTLPELVALGVERQYRKPAKWAAFIYASRQGGGKKPDGDMFKRANEAYRDIVEGVEAG